jgi:hypothetical protein
MRTVIDLPAEQIKALDSIGRKNAFPGRRQCVEPWQPFFQ